MPEIVPGCRNALPRRNTTRKAEKEVCGPILGTPSRGAILGHPTAFDDAWGGPFRKEGLAPHFLGVPRRGPAGPRKQRGLAGTLANERAFTERMLKKGPAGPRSQMRLARTLANGKAFTERMLENWPGGLRNR